MKLSIVTTMYYSEPFLREFYQRCLNEIKKITNDYEIIFVNDGSPDKSLETVIELTREDKNVSVIDLSRNFGHHKAMMTGLSYAAGDLVFLIDSDLEEEPELLGLFHSRLNEEKCDVVFGVQKHRKGGFFERWSGDLFYKLVNYMSDINMPANIITARLMTKRYVDNLLRFTEQELFIAGIWHITGFKQVPVEVIKHSNSETTYTFKTKLQVFTNSVTAFSNKPLVMIFNCGMLITLVSIIFTLYLIIMKIFFSKPLLGWTSLIVSIWFLGGLTISFIGVIGIYLSKVYVETKGRPYTIIREIYGDRHER